MRTYLILITASFFSGITIANAQQTKIFLPLQKTAVHRFVLPATQSFLLMPASDSAKLLSPQNTLPLNFYSSNLGVMCKMELKLEKQTKLPLRIRLGSKDQVDYMEGKYRKF